MRFILLAFVSVFAVAGIAGQTLTGIVVDSDGSAISDAAVALVDSGSAIVRTQTDIEGRFSLSGRITETSSLTVSAQGFARFERRLANDGVRDFTIVLQPAPVSGDVTVSITRTETRLDETPASVVVLSREELDLTGAQAIDDSLRQIAGFTLFRRSSSKTANPTTHGANLRGVSGSGASRANILFDGLSLNDAFGGWTYWSRVPRIAVERVEVLRGGASSIYGTGGLSGAVNLLSGRAEDSPATLRIQASAGTQRTLDGSVFTAYSPKSWSFDLAAEAFTTDGYIPIDEAERGIVDTPANSRHHNGMAGVERRFGSTEGLGGRIFARGNIFSEDRENGTTLTNNRTYLRQASAGGDITSDPIGRLEFRAFLQSQVYDQTFSGVSADRNTETLTRIQRVPSDAGGASVFWTRGFGGAHTLASSIEFRIVEGFSEEVGLVAGVPSSTSRSGGREETIAFFAQDVWRASKRLTLNLGARFDRWENRDALSTTRTLATGNVTTMSFPDRDDSAFSPRVAAIVEATDRVSIYASYARSFRAPTLNELYRGFRVGNVVTQANANLTAETADTFEGGINFNPAPNRFSIRSNVFVTSVSDPVVSVTLSTTPSLITRQRRNVGETRSRGIEVDAEFKPRPEIRLSASYLFVDSRITAFPADVSLLGNELPQVARHQFNVQVGYQPSSRWSLGVQSRASSGQFEDDLNTLRLRPYFTIDATSTFRIRNGLEVFAAAENILNSRYDIGLTPNRTVAAPVFVRVGLRFDLVRR